MRKKRKDDYRTTSEKIHDFFEKHLKKMLLFSVPIALAIFGISYFTQNINGMVAILALYPVWLFTVFCAHIHVPSTSYIGATFIALGILVFFILGFCGVELKL